jgi:hypothetical protein
MIPEALISLVGGSLLYYVVRNSIALLSLIFFFLIESAPDFSKVYSMMESLPESAHVMMARVLVNFSGGQFRDILGRRNTNTSVLIYTCFRHTHAGEASIDRMLSKIVGCDVRSIQRGREADLDDYPLFFSPYPKDVIRHDVEEREELIRIAMLSLDIDMPVKSGQNYRVCFGTLEDKYEKYKQRCIDAEQQYLNYQLWRAMVKQERVVMATKHNNWMCPKCLLSDSEDEAEQKAYQLHLNIWHSQRSFVDTLKAILWYV